MKVKTFEVPVQASEALEKPSITALQVQRDGSLLAGFAFAKPLVLQLVLKADESGFETDDIGLPGSVEGGFAVAHGLRGTTIGDTVFAVLQGGMLPAFASGLIAGGVAVKKSGPELVDYLMAQDGGLGLHVRHTIVQIIEDRLHVRRSKEGGAIVDIAHIGDFIFGLTGTAIWREPYLNTEKRETLRSDLEGNGRLHRDPDGNFWFLGSSGRLLRMGQTDIKAKPTPLKLPGAGFTLSAASQVDGWLYGTCSDSKTLFRVRRNTISHEEEIQTVAQLPQRISGLVAIEREEGPSILLLALEGPQGVELQSLPLIKPEDAEEIPPAPALSAVGRIPELSQLGAIDVDLTDSAKPKVWLGEGRLGGGQSGERPPRVYLVTDL